MLWTVNVKPSGLKETVISIIIDKHLFPGSLIRMEMTYLKRCLLMLDGPPEKIQADSFY